uniref:Uncharacterized protein n=1 Tax=Oryza glumipatula TaxID=40148 RepID=A0A0E0AXE2_9ORYZ
MEALWVVTASRWLVREGETGHTVDAAAAKEDDAGHYAAAGSGGGGGAEEDADDHREKRGTPTPTTTMLAARGLPPPPPLPPSSPPTGRCALARLSPPPLRASAPLRFAGRRTLARRLRRPPLSPARRLPFLATYPRQREVKKKRKKKGERES